METQTKFSQKVWETYLSIQKPIKNMAQNGNTATCSALKADKNSTDAIFYINADTKDSGNKESVIISITENGVIYGAAYRTLDQEQTQAKGEDTYKFENVGKNLDKLLKNIKSENLKNAVSVIDWSKAERTISPAFEKYSEIRNKINEMYPKVQSEDGKETRKIAVKELKNAYTKEGADKPNPNRIFTISSKESNEALNVTLSPNGILVGVEYVDFTKEGKDKFHYVGKDFEKLAEDVQSPDLLKAAEVIDWSKAPTKEETAVEEPVVEEEEEEDLPFK